MFLCSIVSRSGIKYSRKISFEAPEDLFLLFNIF